MPEIILKGLTVEGCKGPIGDKQQYLVNCSAPARKAEEGKEAIKIWSPKPKKVGEKIEVRAWTFEDQFNEAA